MMDTHAHHLPHQQFYPPTSVLPNHFHSSGQPAFPIPSQPPMDGRDTLGNNVLPPDHNPESGATSSQISKRHLGPLGEPVVGQCAGCQEVIHEQYFLKAADRLWHVPCLRCCVCATLLELQPSCFARDGLIYCRKDYHRLFGTRSCAQCGANIEKNEVVMRVRGFVYHTQCFHCCCCQRVLRTGEYFGMLDSHVFCQQDFILLTTNSAVVSSQPQQQPPSMTAPPPPASSISGDTGDIMRKCRNGELLSMESTTSMVASVMGGWSNKENESNNLLVSGVSSCSSSSATATGMNSSVEGTNNPCHIPITPPPLNSTAGSEIASPSQMTLLTSVAGGCNSSVPSGANTFPGMPGLLPPVGDDAAGFTASLMAASGINETTNQGHSDQQHLANLVALQQSAAAVGRFPPPPGSHHPAAFFGGPPSQGPPAHLFFPHHGPIPSHHPLLSRGSGLRSGGKKRRCENEFTDEMLYDAGVDEYCLGGSPPRQKRMRTSFKHHQLRTMKAYFSLNHNPDPKDLKTLSEKTGLSKRVLQVWFQNARAKFRRSALRQENQQQQAQSGSSSGGNGGSNVVGGESGKTVEGAVDDSLTESEVAPGGAGSIASDTCSSSATRSHHQQHFSASQQQQGKGLSNKNSSTTRRGLMKSEGEEGEISEKSCCFTFSDGGSDDGGSSEELDEEQEEEMLGGEEESRGPMASSQQVTYPSTNNRTSTIHHHHRPPHCASSTPNSEFSLSPTHFPDFSTGFAPSGGGGMLGGAFLKSELDPRGKC